MPRIFSGIKPTGEAHLGNFLGAVRNWVTYQDDYDAIYCVVDLHAMTVDHESAGFPDRTMSKAAELLAAGLDPERCLLFIQSHVAEHTELAWILNCVATVGELRRMTQFKDKADKGGGQESVSAGLFDYPVLMAADIALYDTDLVPVGDDQRQHLELTRDVVGRFNHRFGDTLVVPEAAVPKVGARVMDLQNPTAKMSKSENSPMGSVLMVDPPDLVAKKVRSAVTDSGRDVRYDPAEKPGISNLLDIFSAVTGRTIPELEAEYGDAGYGAFKSAVADAVVDLLAPVRERYETLSDDPGEVAASLARGAEKAQAIAGPVMERVRKAVGLLPR
ncbi:MAG TPA: tryptophan--tRNA ligase [Acidimicrobiia bacterium]|jgi:tryptophanyl-tRNA synthetase